MSINVTTKRKRKSSGKRRQRQAPTRVGLIFTSPEHYRVEMERLGLTPNEINMPAGDGKGDNHATVPDA